MIFHMTVKKMLLEEINKLALKVTFAVIAANAMYKNTVLRRYKWSRCIAVAEWAANEILSVGQ